jgi:hypothetical protein
MSDLARWIEYGLPRYQQREHMLFRRWLNEARRHVPVIDRRYR